jgi:hypothetical protein
MMNLSSHSPLPRAHDLDQLKRRAKELLEAFRSGEAAATAEVNGTTVVRMPLPSGFTTPKWFWHAPVALRVPGERRVMARAFSRSPARTAAVAQIEGLRQQYQRCSTALTQAKESMRIAMPQPP